MKAITFLVESGVPSASAEVVAEKTGMDVWEAKKVILDLIADNVVIDGCCKDEICAIVGERTRVAYQTKRYN